MVSVALFFVRTLKDCIPFLRRNKSPVSRGLADDQSQAPAYTLPQTCKICLEWSACISHLQVKLNVQRTLAIELQRLSVQFRKQQKAYLNRLRQKSGPSASDASFSVLDETAGTSGREALDPEYDPGFNEIQVL